MKMYFDMSDLFCNFGFENDLKSIVFIRNMKIKKIRKVIDIFTLTFCMVIICGCNVKNNWHKKQGMIWNTVWHAVYNGNEDAIVAAIDSLESVGNSLSVFDPNSIISRINNNDSCLVDQHLLKVYELSKKINHLTKGYFDPTISPLIDAWGFGKKHTPSADTAAIAEILTFVGIDKTRIENGRLLKNHPNIAFNFSAIAKGYGVDMAAKALQDKGCTDLMFEIGGEIVCRGNNPDGRKWRIMIETPDEEYIKEVFKSGKKPIFEKSIIVELLDEALATSGNYRNYHTESGKTFGHTISPLTGYPIKTDILSASVIAPTCMEADAMATACMAMGSTEAMVLLSDQGLAGAFILTSGEVIVNDRMREHIVRD